MILPVSHKDEFAVIGCCLAGGLDTATEAVESLPIESLTHSAVQRSFLVIEDLATAGKEINSVSFFRAWERKYGGTPPNDILASVDTVPSAANLPMHVSEIIELWRKRRIIETCHAIWTSAQSPQVKVDELIESLEKAFAQDETRTHDTLDAKECCGRLIDDLQRRYDLGGKLSGIPTGFIDLDKKTDGLQYGEQTIVGARPSIGKTALGIGIAMNASFKHKIPTLFVSLEMSVAALMRRACSAWSEIGMSDLRRGSYTAEQFQKFTTFQGFAKQQPLYITDAVAGLGIGQLCAIVRRRVRKHGIKLVIIDYLQKIRAAERNEKRTYEVGEVSSTLRALAVSTGAAFLTLAQLNRESEKDKPRPPRLSDLGDSKQIEQDADTVILIHRDRKRGDGEAMLIIPKQRDGETGAVTLEFNGPFCRFENRSREHEYDTD